MIKATRSVTGEHIPFIAKDGEITILTNLGYVTMPTWVVSTIGYWVRIDDIDKEDREKLNALPVMSDEINNQIKLNKSA